MSPVQTLTPHIITNTLHGTNSNSARYGECEDWKSWKAQQEKDITNHQKQITTQFHYCHPSIAVVRVTDEH